MRQRTPFSQSLGAAWLLFLVVAVALVAGAFGGAWLGAELVARGAPEWVRFLPGSLIFLAVIALLRRVT
jgi:uncharacterized membrane protein YfcA